MFITMIYRFIYFYITYVITHSHYFFKLFSKTFKAYILTSTYYFSNGKFSNLMKFQQSFSYTKILPKFYPFISRVKHITKFQQHHHTSGFK